ncbi:unnamed protein product [Camellia sinensis]
MCRAWESLSVTTICRSLVIVYDGEFIFQIRFVVASPSSDREAVPVGANNLMQGSLYQSVLKSGSLILQPLGDKGIAIIGGDTVRGFTTSDQVEIFFSDIDDIYKIKVMVCRAYRMSNASYCIGRGQTWWLQKAKLHQGSQVKGALCDFWTFVLESMDEPCNSQRAVVSFYS